MPGPFRLVSPTWSRLAAVCSSRCSSCSCSPPPRGRTGFPPRRSTARTPTSSRSATSTSPATARARSPTCARTAASRTRSSRASRRRLAAPERVDPTPGRPPRSGRGRRRQPARRRLDRGRQRLRERRARRHAGPGRVRRPGPARRPEREVDRHRPRRQRRRLRHVAAGRQRARRAAAGHDVDAGPAAAGRRPRRSRPAPGALRPRVAVSAEGYAVVTWGDAAPGITRVWARRVTGLNALGRPAAAQHPRRRQRRLARHRHRGRRLVRVGRVPAGPHRRLAHGRPAARRLAFEAPESIDGGLTADEPKVDMSGGGVGYAVRRANGGAIVGRLLAHHATTSRRRRGSTAPTARPRPSPRWRRPTAATSRSPGAPVRRRHRRPGALQGRRLGAFGPEFTISNPALGPVIDPGVFDRRRPPRRLRGRDGPGHARRLRADRRRVRPRARRPVHRGDHDLQAQDAAGRCAGARASSCGARSASACYIDDVVIGETTNDDVHAARPARRPASTRGRSRRRPARPDEPQPRAHAADRRDRADAGA